MVLFDMLRQVAFVTKPFQACLKQASKGLFTCKYMGRFKFLAFRKGNELVLSLKIKVLKCEKNMQVF